MDQELIYAYKTAKYVAELKNGENIELRVGKICPAINGLITEAACDLAAFVTPENPRSEPLSVEENAVRHDEFLSIVKTERLAWLPGYGCDDEEKWGRENSYLLFLKERKLADKLADRFGQNGYLLIRENEPVKLLLNIDNAYTEIDF